MGLVGGGRGSQPFPCLQYTPPPPPNHLTLQIPNTTHRHRHLPQHLGGRGVGGGWVGMGSPARVCIRSHLRGPCHCPDTFTHEPSRALTPAHLPPQPQHCHRHPQQTQQLFPPTCFRFPNTRQNVTPPQDDVNAVTYADGSPNVIVSGSDDTFIKVGGVVDTSPNQTKPGGGCKDVWGGGGGWGGAGGCGRGGWEGLTSNQSRKETVNRVWRGGM